jgi:hypothetical protein
MHLAAEHLHLQVIQICIFCSDPCSLCESEGVCGWESVWHEQSVACTILLSFQE